MSVQTNRQKKVSMKVVFMIFEPWMASINNLTVCRCACFCVRPSSFQHIRFLLSPSWHWLIVFLKFVSQAWMRIYIRNTPPLISLDITVAHIHTIMRKTKYTVFICSWSMAVKDVQIKLSAWKTNSAHQDIPFVKHNVYCGFDDDKTLISVQDTNVLYQCY